MDSVTSFAWLLTVLVGLQVDAANAATLSGLPYGCKVTLSEQLRDDQFSASNYITQDHMPHHAKPGGGGWMSNRETHDEYLQLDFDRRVEITGLRLDKGYNNFRSRSVRVSYSDDGLVWMAYNHKDSSGLEQTPDPVGDTLSENDEGRVEVLFDPRIRARFIAINPKTYYYVPCMTIEVYGCDVTADTQVPSPTYITSNINENTTWIASQSPIVIDRSIEVIAGAKLVVEDGVTVVFTKDDSGLSVQGYLEAHGTDSAGILFTSNYPALVTDRQWTGIHQVSYDNQVDGLMDLKYTTIRQATDGLLGLGIGVKMGFSLIHSCDTGLKLSTGKERQSTITADIIDHSMVQSAQIFNSKFMYNINGVMLYGGIDNPLFLLYKCEITYSRNGLSVEDWDGKYTGVIYTQLVFVEGDISRNKYGLMVDREVAATLLLLNSKFSYNSEKALVDTRRYGLYDAAHDVEITVEKCSFIDNKQALHFQCSKCDNNKYTIQDNDFRNGALELDVAGRGNIELLRNEFENNSPLEISIDYRVNLINIHKNIFTYVQNPIQLNLKSLTETVVNVTENTLKHVYGKNAIAVRSGFDTIYFGRNAFYNATVENVIYAEKSLLSLERNNFASSNVNPTCLIKIGMSGSNMTFTHNASLNYWGTADIAEVKARICDFFMISSQIRVRIDNIFKTSDMTALLETKNADDFSYNFDEELGVTIIGGEVNTDLSDLAFQGPVLLNRSLFITETGSFSLSGVTVNITEDRGIYVLGRFSIGSNDKNRTVLRSHRNGTSWNGIRMFNPEISVKNAEISGFVNLFKFNKMNANFDNSEIHSEGSVFSHEPFRGEYFNLKVTSSTIDVKSDVIDLAFYGQQHIDIAFTNSTLHSEEGNVIKIQEMSNYAATNVNLQITNSNLSAYFDVVYVRTCAASVTGRVEKSQFVMDRFDGIYIMARDHDFILHDNGFYQHVDGFKVHYCNDSMGSSSTPSAVETRQIDIARNVFSSSRSKTSIRFTAGYRTRPDQYVVNIYDNIFDDQGSNQHKAIHVFPQFDLDLPLTSNKFYIRKNVFKRVETTGIELSGNNEVYIENNTFEDGGRFIDADLVDDKSTKLMIKGNTVSGSSADGIVNLTQPVSSSPTVSLTNNWFVNNSQVVVSLTSPYLQVLNNFFENSNATYNVRVLETSTSYNRMTADASRNYWGTDEGGAIAYTIYDRDANPKLFDVNFMPFLASKTTSDVVSDVGLFRIAHSLLIEGDLSGSVILGARKDPYRIEGVRILTTGRLTIEPGVRIEFGRNKAIVISGQGQLAAMGTQDAPIVMTNAETSYDWKGLEIPSGSASYLRHVIMNHTASGLISRSLYATLQNVTVENSRSNGIRIAIKDILNGANSRSRVKREDERNMLVYYGLRAINNAGHGIYIHDFDASSVTIVLDGCTTTDNIGYGLEINDNTNVKLRDCEISRNQLGGLYANQINGTTTVRSSKFDHEYGTAVTIRDTGGFIFDSSSVRTQSTGNLLDRKMILISTSLFRRSKEEKVITISNNEFVYTSDSFNGIYIYLGSPKNVYVNIYNNVFRGGNTALRVQAYGEYAGGAEFRITGNDVIYISSKQVSTGSEYAIFSFDGSFPDTTLTINNNTFKEKKSPACISITGANNDNNFLVHIENNDFASMTKPFTAYIDVVSHPTMVLRNNRFNNMGNQCYLKAPTMLDPSYTITASHNYWGASSEQELMERVCGFDSYMGRSRVEYMPFFLDAGLTNLKKVYDEFNALQAGSTYRVSTVLVTGGEVAGEVALSESNKDGVYVISRSIWVRKDATLTIEKGVTLEFERGRGIYVDGQLNVLGEDDSVTFLNRSTRWYGIVLSRQSGKPGNASITNAIENAIVENTEFGIVAKTDEFTIKRTEIRNADNNCFTLSPIANGNIDLNGILLKDCSKTGLEIRNNDEVTVSNVFIENATVGVEATVYYAGTMSLKSFYIRHVETTAIAVTLKSGGESIPSVTVEDCAITDAEKGIDVIANQTFIEINVNRNTFKNVKQQAFMMSAGEIYYNNLRSINVTQNNFIDVCSILLTSKGLTDISFEENDVYDTQCQANDKVAVLNVAKDGYGGKIIINANTFRQIEKQYVTHLQGSSEDLHFTGSFYNNYFIGCNATGAVISLGTEHFRMNANSFESPDSQYDILVERHGNGEVDAKNNWFGGKDQNEASKRVYDKAHDQSLLTVTIDPVRLSRPSDCSMIDCNSHGTCVGVICVCYPGWTGISCDTFDCRGAHRCYGNGKCVGPNQCECQAGWEGEVCNSPYTGTPDDDDDDGSGMRPWVAVVIVLALCLLLVTVIVVAFVCRRRHRRDTAYTMASSSEEPVSTSFRPDSKTSQI